MTYPCENGNYRQFVGNGMITGGEGKWGEAGFAAAAGLPPSLSQHEKIPLLERTAMNFRSIPTQLPIE
jgi:hypothetical protein